MNALTGMPRRTGDWIQTYTGRPFYPLDPRPEDICVIDVAHMLSMKCRYSGATRRPYSIAQHAVLLSYAVPPEIGYEALHHDDSETWLPDVCSPLKPDLTGFKPAERRVEAAVILAFRLRPDRLARVKEYDTRILADEKAALLNPSHMPWNFRPEPLGITIRAWSPWRAKRAFLARHAELAPEGLEPQHHYPRIRRGSLHWLLMQADRVGISFPS